MTCLSQRGISNGIQIDLSGACVLSSTLYLVSLVASWFPVTTIRTFPDWPAANMRTT